MSNSWKAKCIESEDNINNFGWKIGETVCYNDGKMEQKYDNGEIGNVSLSRTYTFKEWQYERLFNSTFYTKWELIEEDNTLSAEEVIELLVETIYDYEICIKVYGKNDTFYNIAQMSTSLEIINKLIKYKNSKLITKISKLDYDKIATDKLNKIYPNGWKVEE